MSHLLSSEQSALRQELRRFLADRAPVAGVRDSMHESLGHDAELWSALSDEWGLPAIGVPPEHGGAGGDLLDIAVVMEELGRGVAPVPFLSSAVLAAEALRLSSDDDARARWLPRLADGSAIAALAAPEVTGPSGSDLPLATPAEDGTWVLNGVVDHVLGGGCADVLLVSCGSDRGPDLFLANAESVHTERHCGVDATRDLCRVTLVDAPATRLSAGGNGPMILTTVIGRGTVALACEQVGGARACLELALEHAKHRVQFGRPIGSFQAIKHLLVERMADIEGASASAYRAAWAFDNDLDDAVAHAGISKALASDAYLEAAKAGVQVHGGIGFTWEHATHLYLKRALAGRPLLGSPEHHRDQLSDLLLGSHDDDAAKEA